MAEVNAQKGKPGFSGNTCTLISTAIYNNQAMKKPRCSTIDEWIKKIGIYGQLTIINHKE
jgi:hypothetical protein